MNHSNTLSGNGTRNTLMNLMVTNFGNKSHCDCVGFCSGVSDLSVLLGCDTASRDAYQW